MHQLKALDDLRPKPSIKPNTSFLALVINSALCVLLYTDVKIVAAQLWVK